MISLLADTRRTGYPDDYLVSRIHGRIHRKFTGPEKGFDGAGSFHANDKHIWDALHKERKWLYCQMQSKLRRTLAPLLLYFELNGLIQGLRKQEAENDAQISSISENSIMAEGLQNSIKAGATPAETFTKLEKFLADTPLNLRGLTAAYADGGLQECEEMLRTRFLEQVLAFSIHSAVTQFFQMIIDMRNTITVAKALRWDKRDPQPLLSGGTIKLLRSDRTPSENVLRKMVKRVIGQEQVNASELQPVRLEALINTSLAKKMNRQMRSFDPVQCCSGYIYHCYSTARQQSQDFHASRFRENFSESGAEAI